MSSIRNPFRPGAGHPPPFLAGRDREKSSFRVLLKQTTVLENVVLTGLRGVGKTVLLDALKEIGISSGWRWVGADLSEKTSISEHNMVLRICTDLSTITSSIILQEPDVKVGFLADSGSKDVALNFVILQGIYTETPGLPADKLKSMLRFVWDCIKHSSTQPPAGIVFAYDEAQNLSDHAAKDEFPLSLLLDTFQGLQREGFPFMLVLTGLPTLQVKLVDARTYTERMFRILFLDKLTREDSKQAIVRPIESNECPLKLSGDNIEVIVDESGGYPYFIQFICKEVYDAFIQRLDAGEEPSVPVAEIVEKLDSDFFAGRWARASDRQRDLLGVIASLEPMEQEFTVQEIVTQSKKLPTRAFSPSHVNQMLTTLSKHGLIYKNRYGKYSFAVPQLAGFIRRQDRFTNTL